MVPDQVLRRHPRIISSRPQALLKQGRILKSLLSPVVQGNFGLVGRLVVQSGGFLGLGVRAQRLGLQDGRIPDLSW